MINSHLLYQLSYREMNFHTHTSTFMLCVNHLFPQHNIVMLGFEPALLTAQPASSPLDQSTATTKRVCCDVALRKQTVWWSTLRDSNPRPSRSKREALFH